MSVVEQKPYVISADLENYARRYRISAEGMDEFRDSLTADLTAQGKAVEYIPYEVIRDGIADEIHKNHNHRPLISIDRHYVDFHDVDGNLDITRSNDQTFTERSYHQRPGTPALEAQFDGLGRKYAGREIILVDDVLFTGEALEHIANELAVREVRTVALIAGVAVGGAETIANSLGIDVFATREYAEVEDEVCERDFTLLPGAGKYLHDIGQRAMYWLPKPFSNYTSMASIRDEDIDEFFATSTARNVALLGDRWVTALADDVFGKEMLLDLVGGVRS